MGHTINVKRIKRNQQQARKDTTTIIESLTWCDNAIREMSALPNLTARLQTYQQANPQAYATLVTAVNTYSTGVSEQTRQALHSANHNPNYDARMHSLTQLTQLLIQIQETGVALKEFLGFVLTVYDNQQPTFGVPA